MRRHDYNPLTENHISRVQAVLASKNIVDYPSTLCERSVKALYQQSTAASVLRGIRTTMGSAYCETGRLPLVGYQETVVRAQ